MGGITEILGVPFDVITMDEAVNKVISYMGDNKLHYVCTPNPEIVMKSQKDQELFQILRNADIVVPDGVGIVWASKFKENKLKERVTGYDLAISLLEQLENTDETVYFFGGEPGVATLASKKIKEKYPGLRIAGVRNGYFTQKEEKEIINEIRSLNPSLLLVGLGSPRQEKWIYENLRLVQAKVSIGIGGSFDVMSGKLKRAPKIFTRLGLEWLYRLIKQPTRFKRMMVLPKFVIKVLIGG